MQKLYKSQDFTTQVEDYAECLPELLEVYPLHWKELAVSSDIPLEPHYVAYDVIYGADQLLLVTLREGPHLAGYFMGFLFPEMHYKSCLACHGDIFFILPKYRGGMAGLKLFREVEIACRSRGVQRWHVTSKLRNMAGEDKDSGALLRRLGFTAVEVHYSKRLDK